MSNRAVAIVLFVGLAAGGCSVDEISNIFNKPLFDSSPKQSAQSSGSPLSDIRDASSKLLDGAQPLFGSGPTTRQRPTSTTSAARAKSGGQKESSGFWSSITGQGKKSSSVRVPSLMTPQSSNLSASGVSLRDRISTLRGDIQVVRDRLAQHSRLHQERRSQLANNAKTYQNIATGLYSRAQTSRTINNPVLAGNLRESEGKLKVVAADLEALNRLGDDVAANAAVANFLSDSVRASYGLPGALEQDHQELNRLEQESDRTIIEVGRLLNAMTSDISNYGTFVLGEQANLTNLGLRLKNSALTATAGNPAAAPLTGGGPSPASVSRVASIPGSRGGALLVIRFNRENVSFERELGKIITEALVQDPNQAFEVVGMAPSSSKNQLNRTRRHATRVYRALTRMGVSPRSANIAASAGSSPTKYSEVHVFAR